MRPVSPYLAPDFYANALAKGQHRDIVGGRWDETGRIQMDLLMRAGLQRGDRFLDIGAGSLRLGCRLVPWIDPGHYWATDASGDLMRRGYDVELTAKDRLPPDHLIEDADFAFPGVPEDIDMALAFAVFTHLPLAALGVALGSARGRFPRLRHLLFTVFLVPDAARAAGPFRQPDGVVTHPDRTPYHHLGQDVEDVAKSCGFDLVTQPDRLPRGQVLCQATPTL